MEQAQGFCISRRRFLQMAGAVIAGGTIIGDVSNTLARGKISLPIVARREDEIIPESEILYKAYLVPFKADLVKMGFDETLAEKIIYRVIDGGETPVHAAKPMFFPLIEVLREAGVKPSALIRNKLLTHNFYLLHFSCTFRSHDNSPHPYVWGEMKATFSNVAGAEQPIAFDLSPLTVMDAREVQKEFELSPSLEFKPLKITVSPGKIFKTAVKFTELTPIVIGFGKLTSVAGWEYRRSENRQDIRGNHEGFIILMFSKGAKIKVTVDVRAKVRENFSSRLVQAVSGKWRPDDFRDMTEVVLPLHRAVPVTEEELRTKRWQPDFGDLIQGRGEVADETRSVMLPSG